MRLREYECPCDAIRRRVERQQFRVLRLPAPAPKRNNEITSNLARHFGTEIVFDKRQGQINACRDACRCPNRAVLHVDSIGFDLHRRKELRETASFKPMRSRAAAVEKTRAREQERARANARHPPRGLGVFANDREVRFSQLENARTADHYKRVDWTFRG